jgi:predicted RNA binding protein YcfA (HicA-like mRNA interferase family)
MNSRSLRNISIYDFERFLVQIGCKCTRTKGGHKHYTRIDLNRPITIQTHIDPIPEFIIRNALRNLGLSREEFFKLFKD